LQSPARQPAVTDHAIHFRDPGGMAVDGSAAAISFSQLLANNSMTVELALGGRTVQLSMALGAGRLQVQIAEGHSGKEMPDSQLELFPRKWGERDRPALPALIDAAVRQDSR
jgi:hypothetical protein